MCGGAVAWPRIVWQKCVERSGVFLWGGGVDWLGCGADEWRLGERECNSLLRGNAAGEAFAYSLIPPGDFI